MGSSPDGEKSPRRNSDANTPPRKRPKMSNREDSWENKAPFGPKPEGFKTQWHGKCHCGRVTYELSREKPLSSKYCHCGDCKKLHGAPFQWAAIFHKEDINFANGAEGLGFYHTADKARHHDLPCKVYCDYCRAPIMDEGRNMILLFPPLIQEISSERGVEAFKPQCHLFYPQRVLQFKDDGLVKWEGLDKKSTQLDDDGNALED